MPEPLSDLMGFLAGAFRREAPVTEDAAFATACGKRVTGNDRLTPAEQVDIYRRQFWLRHLDSLREDYPGLEAILGEDAFEALSRAYLAACPPASASLRDLGDRIVGFAEGFEGIPDEVRTAALEMVRYENAFVDLFDGADAPALDVAKLQAMAPEAWETARIVLNPLLVRMRVSYPVHRIRLVVKAGERPEIKAAPAPFGLALYRRDLRIHFEELELLALELLEALAGGEPLVPACARIAAGLDEKQAEELEGKVGAWFQQWSAWGWIIDIAV